MADNIFVGSVSVGVVPDLRGWNDKLRAELIPSANKIGQEMGKQITDGLSKNLDITRAVRDITPKAKAASLVMGREMGKEAIKGFGETFNIGKIIVEATKKAKPIARLAGKELGDVYGRAFRSGLDDALKNVKAKVDVDLNKASLARARSEIRNAAGSGIRIGVNKGIGDGIDDSTTGPDGSRLRGEIGKFFGTGILSGLASLPVQAQIGLAAGAALAAPFIGQVIGGSIIAFLGTGLAALGIAGAVGLGKQVPSSQVDIDQKRLDAANKRVTAAQQRLNELQGKGGASASSLASARARLASAQDHLNKVEGSATATSLGLQAARLRVTAAEDSLNKIRHGGKASASQLTSAEAALESARAGQSAAQKKRDEDSRKALTKGQESVRKSFQDLQTQFYDSMGKIGRPFIPVLKNISKTMSDVLGDLTPIFGNAVKTISKPFLDSVTIFLKSLTDPQVTSSIQAVADAFAEIMKAFAPDIPGIVHSFADAIERVAQAVSKNPKAFADFLNFMFQVGIFAVNVIAFLTNVADWIESHWPGIWEGFKHTVLMAISPIAGFILTYIVPIIHGIAKAAEWVRDHWKTIWEDVKKAAKATWDGIRKIFASFIVDGILGPLGTILHGAAVAFGWIPGIGPKLKTADKQFQDFKNSVNESLGGINDQTVNVSVRMTAKTNPYPGGISGRAARGMYIGSGSFGVDDQLILAQRGELVVPTSMVNAGAVDHLRGSIPGFASGGQVGFDIRASTPTATQTGKFLWAETVYTVQNAMKDMGTFGAMFGQTVSNVGSGVKRWTGIVLQALSMLGMPASLLGRVLYQMQTESGGNPNAINLWDSNAKAGDPSRGLMQTIGSTFAAYHVAGTSWNIYDPLANIAAAINYARHRYGPSLGALGSGHGYAGGTGGAAPGWAWVGENGPELVHFKGGEQVVPTGILPGYASGTENLIRAQIASDRVRLQALQNSLRQAGTALARAHYQALIRVEQARIQILQERLDKLLSGHTSTLRGVASSTSRSMQSAGATLAARIARITLSTTPASWASTLALFFKDLRLYFNPKTAEARSRLVQNQITQMKSLQAHIADLNTNIAAANEFQRQQLVHLQQTTGIGTIGIQGTGAAGGRSILEGLTRRLASVRSFGLAIRDLDRAGASQSLLKTVAAMDPASGTVYARKMLQALRKMHSMKLSRELINQLVALGPDAALAYLNAIQAAGPSVLRQIKSTEAALQAANLAVSRGTASVVAGGAYVTGANFVAGLKSQEKALEKQFAHLGHVLGAEAIKWMRVPYNKRPRGYQHGGWLEEPVAGYGLYSGAMYTFAEKGREYVVPEGSMASRGGDGGTQYVAHFDGLTREAIEQHVRTAFNAMSLQQGALQRQGRRSL